MTANQSLRVLWLAGLLALAVVAVSLMFPVRAEPATSNIVPDGVRATLRPRYIEPSPRTPILSSGITSKPVRIQPKPKAKSPAKHSIVGIASWGPFGGHVVTRLPRGTNICVYGPLGHWCGKSWGYGPAKRTGRIVDLDKEVFNDIVGDPYRLGLGKVRLVWW